jgi:hypothetical protein
VIGTMRRECLDWLIPLNERHLRRILTEWVAPYHRGRQLGLRSARTATASHRPQPSGHHLPDGHRIEATPIPAELHHKYRLAEVA